MARRWHAGRFRALRRRKRAGQKRTGPGGERPSQRRSRRFESAHLHSMTRARSWSSAISGVGGKSLFLPLLTVKNRYVLQSSTLLPAGPLLAPAAPVHAERLDGRCSTGAGSDRQSAVSTGVPVRPPRAGMVSVGTSHLLFASRPRVLPVGCCRTLIAVLWHGEEAHSRPAGSTARALRAICSIGRRAQLPSAALCGRGQTPGSCSRSSGRRTPRISSGPVGAGSNRPSDNRHTWYPPSMMAAISKPGRAPPRARLVAGLRRRGRLSGTERCWVETIEGELADRIRAR